MSDSSRSPHAPGPAAPISEEIRVKAGFATALSFHKQGLTTEAETIYRQILTIQPAHFNALHMLGVIAMGRKDYARAVELIGEALKVDPENPVYADAYVNLGVALNASSNLQGAIDAYTKAIQLNPRHAEAHFNLGNIFRGLKRNQQAVEHYNQAILRKPQEGDFYCNRAHALRDVNQFRAAIADYDKAIASNVRESLLLGARFGAKMQICDWMDYDTQRAALIDKIENGESVTHPFPVLGFSDSLGLQRKAAEILVRTKYPADDRFGAFAPRKPYEKIRVGYFSMDFHNHPVSHLTARLFELHDREKFEIYAFSYGPPSTDDMRKRLEGAFDRFVDVQKSTDEDIVALARTLQIDIAVDLAGHTAEARTGIFAMRAAPVQIAYIGYVGSMGAPYIDYMIGDKIVIPDNDRQHFSEKIIDLPCFQARDTKSRPADRVFTRQEVNLPENGFVFSCFNNTYKISPMIFSSWMRILRQVDTAVLWLHVRNAEAIENLRNEAATRGIDPARLIFAGRLPMADYLARFKVADLFLDTMPYNAGATASDALWAGLPLLTCTGHSFAARMGASLLTAVGLPELITASPEEYEQRAVDLAKHPEKIAALKQKLANTRDSARLFDIRTFTSNLETAYRKTYDRRSAGLRPDHIVVG